MPDFLSIISSLICSVQAVDQSGFFSLGGEVEWCFVLLCFPIMINCSIHIFLPLYSGAMKRLRLVALQASNVINTVWDGE